MSLLRIFFIVFGVAALVSAMYMKAQSDRAVWWHSTNGTITHSFVDKVPPGVPHANPLFYPIVRYSYNVNGNEFTGNTINLGAKIETTSRYANEMVSSYKKGALVKVYYDPSAPVESVLEQRVSGSFLSMLIFTGIIFVLFGLYFRKGVLHMTESLQSHWRAKRTRHSK